MLTRGPMPLLTYSGEVELSRKYLSWLYGRYSIWITIRANLGKIVAGSD
jgi:hypothetical protein